MPRAAHNKKNYKKTCFRGCYICFGRVVKPKRGVVGILVVFQDRGLCTAITFKSSWRELSNDVTEHRSMLKKYQNPHYFRFSFLHETGVIHSKFESHREMYMLGQQALPRCHALVYAACFPSRRGEYPFSVLAPRTKPNQLESSKHPCCEFEVRLGWAASFSLSLVGVALRKFLKRGLACHVLFIHHCCKTYYQHTCQMFEKIF